MRRRGTARHRDHRAGSRQRMSDSGELQEKAPTVSFVPLAPSNGSARTLRDVRRRAEVGDPGRSRKWRGWRCPVSALIAIPAPADTAEPLASFTIDGPR
jgi:hypothetical protein